VEIEDKLTIKEALQSAISAYNKTVPNQPIIELLSSYKIRLSKKSGLPDMDLPGKMLII
jgi:hypothetical protein